LNQIRWERAYIDLFSNQRDGSCQERTGCAPLICERLWQNGANLRTQAAACSCNCTDFQHSGVLEAAAQERIPHPGDQGSLRRTDHGNQLAARGKFQDSRCASALVPILWESGIGSDVMKPIAASIASSMITSNVYVLILAVVLLR
jgi:hypothetical protein